MNPGEPSPISPDPENSLFRVDLGDRSYDIVIGGGLLAESGERLAELLPHRQAVLVSDDHVAPLYGQVVEESLRRAGFEVRAITLPHGEATKDFKHLAGLLEEMLAWGVERRTALLALGGGVIGDITGFAASVLLRGVPFVQLPTTLLSQVDSAVGGKTGINTPQGKNLVGSFYQPRLVLSDMDSLDSLPRRELLAGYAEVVKYGLIDQPAFFAWLEAHGARLLAGESDARRHAVITSCAAKARIVAQDETELGRRALLNLGHTFGHALEAEAGYGDALLHGEAVAIGTMMAFDLSVRLGLCPAEDRDRTRHHFEDVGLPVDLSGLNHAGWTASRLIDHMGRDKKVHDSRLTFILCRGIGQAFQSRDVTVEDLTAVLETYLTPTHQGSKS